MSRAQLPGLDAVHDIEEGRSPAASPAVSESNDLGEAARQVARSLRRPSVSPVAIGLSAAAIDCVAVTLAVWFAAYAASEVTFQSLRLTALAFAAAALAVSIVAQAGGYRLHALRGFWRGAGLVFGVALCTVGAGAVLDVWPAPHVPIVGAAIVALGVALVPARLLVSAIARWALDFGLTERRAIVVGGGANAADLIRGLAANPRNDIRICGIFDDRDESRSPAVVVGVPKIGAVSDLVAFTRAGEIDMLIVTLPLGAERRIREILAAVRVLPLDVRLSAYSDGYEFPRRQSQAPGEAGLIDVLRRPLGGEGRLVKRAFDAVLAACAIVVLSPLMLATATAIRLESKGPVLFRQLRHGYNHKPIEIWKFRSMRIETCDPDAREIVTRGDSRVTRVGRFIRRWSIDELPQLFNVLRGDLSLVGPRPHALDAVSSRHEAFESIVDGYAARHRVPPGVTGWAQIHGWRGEIDDPAKLKARFEHDLYYIENRSMALDLYVLAMTPLRLLNTRNAY